jgi:hypothetical protein
MKQYGICHLSVVPMRAEAGDRHEMTSQLLFGDCFEIISQSEDGKWKYIQNDFDSYKGWIDAKQYLSIDEAYMHKLNLTPAVFCKSLYALAKSETRFFPLLMGSTVPLYKNGIIVVGDEPYILEGDVGYAEPFNAKKIEQTALLYLGSPYLWGGRTHFGIDCSGYIQQLFRMYSIPLPRDAYQQAELGITIPFEHYQQGDLAFFKNESDKITHVGMMLNGNKIIHASGQVRMDLIDEQGIVHVEKRIYTHRLAFIKRVGV